MVTSELLPASLPLFIVAIHDATTRIQTRLKNSNPGLFWSDVSELFDMDSISSSSNRLEKELVVDRPRSVLVIIRAGWRGRTQTFSKVDVLA
jgi:hypothetical protein